MSPIRQCGECSALFILADEYLVAGEVMEACPLCLAPESMFSRVSEQAIWWMFYHIIGNGGFSEVRRMNLRALAEEEMGPWHDHYRQY